MPISRKQCVCDYIPAEKHDTCWPRKLKWQAVTVPENESCKLYKLIEGCKERPLLGIVFF